MKKITKKSRIETARRIIDRNVNFVPFSNEDVAELSIVCEVKIYKAELRPNPKFPKDNRHLYMEIEGYDFRPISWKKLINGYDEKTNVKKVMREAVSIDVWDYKKNMKLICEICGSTEHPSVDHIYPPFDWIAEKFIEKNSLPKIETAKDGVGDIFVDNEVKKLWIVFHREYAKYQILCKSCNSSKGKR